MEAAMQLRQLDKFIGQAYDGLVQDFIDGWAKVNRLTINIVPTQVDNIDVDDHRLNIWIDFNTGKINKFTIG